MPQWLHSRWQITLNTWFLKFTILLLFKEIISDYWRWNVYPHRIFPWITFFNRLLKTTLGPLTTFRFSLRSSQKFWHVRFKILCLPFKMLLGTHNGNFYDIHVCCMHTCPIMTLILFSFFAGCRQNIFRIPGEFVKKQYLQ